MTSHHIDLATFYSLTWIKHDTTKEALTPKAPFSCQRPTAYAAIFSFLFLFINDWYFNGTRIYGSLFGIFFLGGRNRKRGHYGMFWCFTAFLDVPLMVEMVLVDFGVEGREQEWAVSDMGGKVAAGSMAKPLAG